MTTQQKALWSGVVVLAILGGLAFFGLTPFGKSVVNQIAGSPAGTTFGTAKIAEAAIFPSTQLGSTSSILNTDSFPRIIIDNGWTCFGANGQGESILAATTSVSGLGLQGNANYIVANNFATTSTTGNVETSQASTTEGVINGVSRLWPAGAYLSFVVGTSTTFASTSNECLPYVHYIGS